MLQSTFLRDTSYNRKTAASKIRSSVKRGAMCNVLTQFEKSVDTQK